MDDPMFSGLMVPEAKIGPQGANMIAEPAQVMVLVPQSATQTLKAIQTGLWAFGAFIVLALVAFGVWQWRRKVPDDYHGTMLPGAPSSSGPPSTAANSPGPIAKDLEAPVKHDVVVRNVDDIVQVSGPLPVWYTETDVAPADEAKVTENDASIQAMIRQREALSKDIETFQSTHMNAHL